MSTRPRYSIVIPTYNRAATVRNTLSGCFAQTVSDIEVIVVDDGSSDNTVEVLKGVDDARLVVLQQVNAGPAAARNHGMRAAKGEYIAFLDSDDVWYPSFLEEVEKAYALNANCVVYSQIIVDRGVSRYWVKPDRAMRKDEPIFDYLYVHGGFIQTSTMVIPAELAKNVSWDESVTFGDNDQFAIDCWHTGIDFYMLDKPLTLYADFMSSDALSQLPIFAGHSEKHTNFFRWMETQRTHMSEHAWLGYKARFESVGLARKHPIQSLKLLLKAKRSGAMSTGGMCRQLLQNYFPRFYRRLIDQYVRLRGARLHTFEK